MNIPKPNKELLQKLGTEYGNYLKWLLKTAKKELIKFRNPNKKSTYRHYENIR